MRLRWPTASSDPPRPASPQADFDVARGNANDGARPIPRPAAFPTFDRAGLRARGTRRIAFPPVLPAVAGWIRPRTLTVAGAAEALAALAAPHLFPVSPRRFGSAGTPRTSALIVQHKSLKAAGNDVG